jgi:hypothetical protein
VRRSARPNCIRGPWKSRRFRILRSKEMMSHSLAL